MRSTLHRTDGHGSAGRNSQAAASSGTSRGGYSSRRAAGRDQRKVHAITAAPRSRREDQNNRIRNYLISMGIRTVCFALAGLFAVTTSWTTLAWICVVAAALLPYPAVVFANAVDRRRDVDVVQTPMRMIGAGPMSPGGATGSRGFTTASHERTREEHPHGEGHEQPAARWYAG